MKDFSSVQAKLDEADRLLAAGSQAFRAQDLKTALGHYARIPLFLNALIAAESQLRPYANSESAASKQEWASCQQIRRKALLNLAQIDILQGNWEKCLRRCKEVAPLDPANPKLRYRRALANIRTGRFEEVQADLIQLEEPVQKQLARELAQARKEQDRASSELMRKMFK